MASSAGGGENGSRRIGSRNSGLGSSSRPSRYPSGLRRPPTPLEHQDRHVPRSSRNPRQESGPRRRRPCPTISCRGDRSRDSPQGAQSSPGPGPRPPIGRKATAARAHRGWPPIHCRATGQRYRHARSEARPAAIPIRDRASPVLGSISNRISSVAEPAQTAPAVSESAVTLIDEQAVGPEVQRSTRPFERNRYKPETVVAHTSPRVSSSRR